jgi:hypothetical protein
MMTNDDVDHLFELPLGEFTAARNALAKHRGEAGDAEAARTIKALKKPTSVAWIINQLARREPEAVAALLSAGEQLRKAQRKAMSKAGAADLREATRAERGAIADLVRRARPIIEQAGITGSRTHLAAIEDTLAAAAIDQEAADALRAGRLAHELHRAGFGEMTGLSVVSDDEGPGPQETSSTTKERAAELARDARVKESEAKRSERAAAQARARYERLRAQTTKAEQAANEARFAAGLARKTANEARTRAAQATAREKGSRP